MCHFPTDVKYSNEMIGLSTEVENKGLAGTAKGMYSKLRNLGIVNDKFLKDVDCIDDLERQIFSLIDNYPENGASLERIFHMIEIWGGSTGIWIYINKPFPWKREWEIIEPYYKVLVDVCRSINEVTPEACDLLYNAISSFYKSLQKNKCTGLGVAFITKHTRFWMHKNLPEGMLPIYDSTFSIYVMKRGDNAQLRDLRAYWDVMIKKAEQEGISLAALERIIFNYYRKQENRSRVNEKGNRQERVKDGIHPLNGKVKSPRLSNSEVLSGYQISCSGHEFYLFVGKYHAKKKIFCQVQPGKGGYPETIKLGVLENQGFEHKSSGDRYIRFFDLDQKAEAINLMESLKDALL